MRFCVIPKNIKQILKTRRVVINESNVQEFANDIAQSTAEIDSGKKSQSGAIKSFTAWHLRFNPAQNSTKVPNYQSPQLAQNSSSNPFYNENFPNWAFTNPVNGCSLILVPEALSSNRQEECDVIIKK